MVADKYLRTMGTRIVRQKDFMALPIHPLLNTIILESVDFFIRDPEPLHCLIYEWTVVLIKCSKFYMTVYKTLPLHVSATTGHHQKA
jgi:hypothetical protein